MKKIFEFCTGLIYVGPDATLLPHQEANEIQ